MKYLYVLTSDDSDFFLEEALLSITSLRLQIPNAFISLLTDVTTETNLIGKRSEIHNLVDELVIVKIDEPFNKKACSRWLKTSMRQHIKGDFLFIDSDTIITDDLSPITDMDINMGAVLDHHAYLSGYKKYIPDHFQWLQNLYTKLGFTAISNSDTYYNSGVILCKDRDIVHKFFKEWHKLWFFCFERGVVTDQQSFNQANYNLNNVIRELDGKWNCLIMANGSINYLHTAKIIHYNKISLKKNPYLLSNQDIHKNIKETGFINQELKDILLYSKSLFFPNTQLKVMEETIVEMDDAALKFYKSASCAVARRIYNSKIGFVFDSIFSFIRKKKNRS